MTKTKGTQTSLSIAKGKTSCISGSKMKWGKKTLFWKKGLSQTTSGAILQDVEQSVFKSNLIKSQER